MTCSLIRTVHDDDDDDDKIVVVSVRITVLTMIFESSVLVSLVGCYSIDDTQHAISVFIVRLFVVYHNSRNGLPSGVSGNPITSIASTAFSGLTALQGLFALMIVLFRHSERVFCVID